MSRWYGEQYELLGRMSLAYRTQRLAFAQYNTAGDPRTDHAAPLLESSSRFSFEHTVPYHQLSILDLSFASMNLLAAYITSG
jgi:hypothetical protein